MARALQLARRALGRTAPNPAVGAVIVNHGRIVGEGYHRRAGLPHAEVEAIRRAGLRARRATLYVTLEPCQHTGRTPPCCDAILSAGLARVVAATVDPNPLTRGRGFTRLRRAGIVVMTGVLKPEAQRLIEPFSKVMRAGLPFVIGKIGQSLDGKIATANGESRWITSPASRRLAHEWRSRADAMLVGVRTVLRDDPRLTVRGVPHRPGRPVRVIVDSRLRTPLTARCLARSSATPTLIATTRHYAARSQVFKRRGVEVVVLPARNGRVSLVALCRLLAARGLHTVLIEGGGEVMASALNERLIDRLVWIVAPMLIGGRAAPGSVGGTGVAHLARAIRLREVSCRRVGPDLCVEARVVYPRPR